MIEKCTSVTTAHVEATSTHVQLPSLETTLQLFKGDDDNGTDMESKSMPE